MYGISNSQQQGGGGGSAASYTKIESTIATSDWTDNTPSWIGQNALTWTSKNGLYYIQGGTEDLGLVEGGSYTTVATIDGTDYNQSDAEVVSIGGTVVYFAYFNNDAVIMRIADHCIGLDENGYPVPGNGYLVMVRVEGTPSSVIIKSCSAASGGKEAIINNSAIKTNSAVTMYVDYDGKMSAVKKIDGSLTVSVSTMPTIDISYAIEIVDTNVEGLFEIVNGYVPAAGVTDYDGLSNVPIVHQNLAQSGFTPVKNTYYLHTGNTNENYTKGVIYKCVETTDTSKPLQLFEVISRYELETLLKEEVSPYISKRKFISQSSKNVSITGSSEPYLFTVVDNDLKSTLYIRSFVNLYPRDETTEQWLKDHMLSSIIEVNEGKFSFKVNIATLPTTFNLDYVILNVIN